MHLVRFHCKNSYLNCRDILNHCENAVRWRKLTHLWYLTEGFLVYLNVIRKAKLRSAKRKGDWCRNEPHSIWKLSLVFRSQEGYQLKETHRKARARTARLRISIQDLPNRKEKCLPLECADVERNKRQINPWMLQRWLKISSHTCTISKTYLIFPWLAFITSVAQTSFREKMWRKECVRCWDMG